ncbi:uncharacterized protein VDAG_02989 [Verticillium dahliae VdLs.17]|uniref:Uncharacterized protein n=1 Tax=Verticillium dahliae (strain VdLs.17 / ATCC MYA-4575 / FGSC 10137) TaxID=498257 RepID=G2WXL0_VERDV|nr:uncharacterized protein VDAG_02989 [Verticillium dahliae VdLs.17]EGY21465.1 hypothetical protein VDAG_02989 [Verticillium dahliae VdLs.17]KAH6707467.1 hypothetical protein EV126DRAFT_378912 [Verticillium dahliae]
MHIPVRLLATAVVAASVSSCFKHRLSFYNGNSCNSAALGSVEVEASPDCHTDHVGVAQSFTVKGLGDGENPDYVVMFASDDCNPETIIDKAEAGCLRTGDGPNYGSFQLKAQCQTHQRSRLT